MKKIYVIVLMISISIFTFAKESVEGCKAFLLGDSKGNIYYSKNIEEKLPLASVTKMMTLMLTFEQLEKNKIHMQDKVKIPEKIASIGGSRIWMKGGMVFSLNDLIKASAIYSANNATQAIANYVSSGNVDLFVKKMNNKLKDLNIEEEIDYHTPTGLPPYMTGEKMDIGSAKGLYLLSMYAEKNKDYIKIASQKEAKIKVGKILNRNKLLGTNGIYGIKTGHHDTAGYNICIASKEGDTKLFVVVLGAKDEKTRDQIVLKYIKKFKHEYIYRNILDTDVALSKVKVLGGQDEYVKIYPDKNLKKIFKVTTEVNIKVKRKHFVTAPVEKNEKMGTYEVFINNKKIMDGNLISKKNISIYSPF